jgi:hypothetical protein
MYYLISFNESIISKLTGLTLLTTLLSLSSFSQSKTNLKQKAELSIIDSNSYYDVIQSLHTKGFDDVQINSMKSNKFLFTSGTDLKYDQAVLDAKNDITSKIKLLDYKIGKQSIYKSNKNNIWTVIIVTELNPTTLIDDSEDETENIDN